MRRSDPTGSGDGLRSRAGARRDRALGAVVGLAVGDALGTTLESCARDSKPPVTDMTGGGAFGRTPGEWTDDTSMALCLTESILHCGRVEPRDLMERFTRWWKQGENSVTGECFDIGGATTAALSRFAETGDPLAGSTSPDSAGNGSLMRLSPVAVRWCADPEAAEDAARLQSRTTHGAPEAVEACALYVRLLVEAVAGRTPAEVLRPREWPAGEGVAEVAAGAWRGKTRDRISSSGYVVHTLEAALWSVAGADSFRGALLTAVNLGDDADTVGAVAGQLAGALWGLSGIPADWVAKLAWRDRILELAEALYAASRSARLRED